MKFMKLTKGLFPKFYDYSCKILYLLDIPCVLYQTETTSSIGLKKMSIKFVFFKKEYKCS